MQLLGQMQHNMSNDKLIGRNWSSLWHDLPLFSLCSSTRGHIPHSWCGWDSQSSVKHPNTMPGMWVPGSGLSTGKVHACLDKPSGEWKMLILMVKIKNDTSSWPLKLLFSAHDVLLPTYPFVGRSQRATSVTVRGGELLVLLLNSL